MPVKVKDVAAAIEAFAPLSLQEEYDNSGLNVGDYEAGVTGVLLCVDVTESVIDEALSLDANLVVSHHPLLFHPLRQLVDADFTQRIVRRALLAGCRAHQSGQCRRGHEFPARETAGADRYAGAFAAPRRRGNGLRCGRGFTGGDTCERFFTTG